MGQVQAIVAATHADKFDLQRRLPAGRRQQLRVEQHQSVGGGTGDLPGAGLDQAVLADLRAGQAIAHPVLAHLPAAGVSPRQAARGASPDDALAVDQQTGGRGGRETLIGTDALQQAQTLAVPAVMAQLAHRAQPEIALTVEGHREQRIVRTARDRCQPLLLWTPLHQPVIGHQPWLAVRAALQVLHEQLPGKGRRSCRHAPQQATVQVAHLQAHRAHVEPQLRATGPGHRHIAGIDRIDRILLAPAQELAIGRVVAVQQAVEPDPDPAVAVLGHALRPQQGVDHLEVVPDLAAGRIQPVQRTAGAGQPQPALAGRRGGQHVGVAHRGRVAVIVAQHRELAPVGGQVPQVGVHAGKPQPAVAVLVGGDPVGLDQAMGRDAVQRHVADRGLIPVAQARGGVEPVGAGAVVQQGLQHRDVRSAAPGLVDEAAIGLAQHHAQIGGNP